MRYQIDHPFVRREYRCPVCRKAKEPGCIVCWQCHNEMDGCYGEAVETMLDELEDKLAAEYDEAIAQRMV